MLTVTVLDAETNQKTAIDKEILRLVIMRIVQLSARVGRMPIDLELMGCTLKHMVCPMEVNRQVWHVVDHLLNAVVIIMLRVGIDAIVEGEA